MSKRPHDELGPDDETATSIPHGASAAPAPTAAASASTLAAAADTSGALAKISAVAAPARVVDVERCALTNDSMLRLLEYLNEVSIHKPLWPDAFRNRLRAFVAAASDEFQDVLDDEMVKSASAMLNVMQAEMRAHELNIIVTPDSLNYAIVNRAFIAQMRGRLERLGRLAHSERLDENQCTELVQLTERFHAYVVNMRSANAKLAADVIQNLPRLTSVVEALEKCDVAVSSVYQRMSEIDAHLKQSYEMLNYVTLKSERDSLQTQVTELRRRIELVQTRFRNAEQALDKVFAAEHVQGVSSRTEQRALPTHPSA